uniref:LITAF domain-containing protein n=1 Tax=Salarias fasciatus TaxID=181472 RepID=A0A672H5J5_SALFA
MSDGGPTPQPEKSTQQAPPYPGPPLKDGGPMLQPEKSLQEGIFPDVPSPPAYEGLLTRVIAAPPPQDAPKRVVCQHCMQSVVTNVEHTSGLLTWLACGGLTLVGCIPCCCIPFCADSCQDIEHRCPACKGLISVHKRL